MTLKCRLQALIQGVEQKYNKMLRNYNHFIHSPPIFRRSNVIGQIKTIINKMFICNTVLRMLCRWWLGYVWTHGHQQRLGFFFVMLARSLLQLTSVVVCLWLFLSLVLSSASEMLLDRVEIRRLSQTLLNITLFYLHKLLGCFCCMFWVIVHLYSEAPLNQLCCMWLNLCREYISIHFRIDPAASVFCLIITKHFCLLSHHH